MNPAQEWPSALIARHGGRLEVFDQIDSTNAELIRRARQEQAWPGYPADTPITLLVARHQTAGRGRLGRTWFDASSPCDALEDAERAWPSLMFSLGMRYAPLDWSGLSLAVGVSLAQTLNRLLAADPQASPVVQLKWPNDLWSGQRKLGGILIETASFGGVGDQASRTTRYAVIGVGLNLKTPGAEDLRNAPVGLWDLSKERLSASAVLAAMVPELLDTVWRFEQQGFAPFRASFAALDMLWECPVGVVRQDGQEVNGLAQGVDDDACLRVLTAQGVVRVYSGEVSVRPK